MYVDADTDGNTTAMYVPLSQQYLYNALLTDEVFAVCLFFSLFSINIQISAHHSILPAT